MREETDYAEALEAFKDDPSVVIEPWGRSIDHLRLTIHGKENTPYYKGKFLFEIKFPENYPFTPPFFQSNSHGKDKRVCGNSNVA